LESLRVEVEHMGLLIGVANVLLATTNAPFFDKARSKLDVKPVAPPPILSRGSWRTLYGTPQSTRHATSWSAFQNPARLG
jgi:hypothetical protein